MEPHAADEPKPQTNEPSTPLSELLSNQAGQAGAWDLKVHHAEIIPYEYTREGKTHQTQKLQVILLSHDPAEYCIGLARMQRITWGLAGGANTCGRARLGHHWPAPQRAARSVWPTSRAPWIGTARQSSRNSSKHTALALLGDSRRYD